MKKTLYLPRQRLSYSQMDCWLNNKPQYIARYFRGEKGFETPELLFGKKIAKALEDHEKHPILDHVLRYPIVEHKIELEVNGVPFLGFLDTFDPVKGSIGEYKTGKIPWDPVRVAKHKQLVVYSLLVKLQTGLVDPIVKLIWIETQNSMRKQSGLITHEDSHGIEFTGRIEEFDRKIFEYERKNMAKLIRTVAEDISEAFTEYEKTINA